MIKRCERGHFFDDEKNIECPYCSPEMKKADDTEKRCKNCNSVLGDNLFCKVCGTRNGDRKFEPEDNIMQCLYAGPDVFENPSKRYDDFEATTAVNITSDNTTQMGWEKPVQTDWVSKNINKEFEEKTDKTDKKILIQKIIAGFCILSGIILIILVLLSIL